MRIIAIAATILLVVTAAARMLLAEEAAPQQPTETSAKKSQKVMVIREAGQPEGFPKLTAIGQIVVKQYPVYRAARVSGDELKQNSMFGTLFKHIKKNNIAMTAPVEMTYGDDARSSMAFLYANVDIGTPGSDGSVEVVDIPAMTVVGIGVRGNYSQTRFEDNLKLLQTWLTEHSTEWVADGQPRYLAFNSPFVPGLLKYGEVQIPIRKAADFR